MASLVAVAAVDIVRSEASPIVQYYPQVFNTQNTTLYQALETQNQQVVNLFARIRNGQANASDVHRSIENINDSVRVFRKRIERCRHNPDETMPWGTSVWDHTLGPPSPPRNPTNTLASFRTNIHTLEQAIPDLQTELVRIERRDLCKKAVCYFVLAATAVIAGICLGIFLQNN